MAAFGKIVTSTCIFLGILTGASGTTSCYHYSYIYASYNEYYGECNDGCCGDDYDRSCCAAYVEESDYSLAFIMGGILGGVIIFALVVSVGIVICCKMYNYKKFKVGQAIAQPGDGHQRIVMRHQAGVTYTTNRVVLPPLQITPTAPSLPFTHVNHISSPMTTHTYTTTMATPTYSVTNTELPPPYSY